MKNFLLWLVFSTCVLSQTLPWTGSGNDAWLKQSPNALVLPKAGNYIKLSGQTNQLSVAGGVLLLDGNPIGGTTIYTGDGTLPSDRFVDGDGHLMSFFGNGLFLAESASGSTIQGGTNLIAIAPAGIEFRTPGLPAATSGQILTLSGGLVDYFDVVGSFGGQTNWGIVVRDPSDGTAKNTGVTIADIITGGGPGGTNQNFANTDLTFTGSRTHDADGNDLTIQNIGTGNFKGNSLFISDQTTGSRFSVSPASLAIESNDGSTPFYFYSDAVYNGTAVTGQVWTAIDGGTGQAEWADLPAGQNISNADLTWDGNHSYDGNASDIDFDNFNSVYWFADSQFQIESSTGTVRLTSVAGEVAADGIGVSVLASNGYGNAGDVFTTDGAYATWQAPLFPLNGVPTVAAGAGAGGSPTVTLANETDSAFTLNVTAGTSPATDDDIAVISFATTNYLTAPHFSLSPGNKPAATLSGASQVWVTTTTTNLTLHSNSTGLAATTNYVWEIIVVR